LGTELGSNISNLKGVSTIDSRKIPLASFKDDAQGLGVFELKAKPEFAPIDFNIFALTETIDWSTSDRMRFWYVQADNEKLPDPLGIFNVSPHFLLRRLDKEEDAFCHCRVNMDGEVVIWSNDSDYAEDFFGKVFVNVPPAFHEIRDWKISKEWLNAASAIAMFLGSLNGAMGWTDRIPPTIDRSIEEAKANYDLKKWNPCVVMCRRAVEELMQLAFRRFFEQDPKELDFNDIIRRFEKEKRDVIPKHWIGVLDSVRSIGNVPGAHPEVKGYKFTRVDADLALTQTVAFREAYFSKIDKEVGTVYTLEIDPKKQ
jgi:HEPN domain-containing protein